MTLKEEIITILRSFFVDGGIDNNGDEVWGVPERADRILTLLQKRVEESLPKEIVGDILHQISDNEQGFNEALLKVQSAIKEIFK